MIHPTAIISSNANIGTNVQIGAYSIIEDNVTVGDNCIIASNVLLKANTRIGKNNKLSSGVIIGETPQDVSQQGVVSAVEIGDDNVIREYVTIHRGSSKQDRLTKIGNNNFFMVYSHVGHDAVIGNKVILTNGAAIGGHAVINDYAIIGAFCTIHQFCQVGAYTMMSRGAMVNKDVLPYLMIAENKPKVFGLNKRGLQRNGFSRDDIRVLSDAYKIIFRENLTTEQAIEQLKLLVGQSTAVQGFINGLEHSTRGIVR
jgi:UDP-N-acetylglucosamine acyltransferase